MSHFKNQPCSVQERHQVGSLRCDDLGGSPQGAVPWGEDPMATGRRWHYLNAMNILLLMVVLLLLFGGGGFYLGGPVIGGSGLGLILLICLVVFLAGGFRTTKN